MTLSAMSLGRKILVAVIFVSLAGMAYLGYGIFYTVRHIPEAHAARDTGALLTEYMRSHEGKWPSSWDDLLSVTNTEAGRRIVFHRVGIGDMKYANWLR